MNQRAIFHRVISGLLFVGATVAQAQSSAPATSSSPPPPTRSVGSIPCLAEPALAPDGSEIAFVSGGDIWTVSAAGGDARLLISDAGSDSRPLFSPDGQKLAFVSTRSGNGDIYILTLATGQVQRLTFSDSHEQLDAWSDDGKYLYFTSSSAEASFSSNGIWRIKSDGGTPMPVIDEMYVNEFFAAPAPDGSTLAYCAGGMSERTWWRKGHSHGDACEIYLARLQDGRGVQPQRVGPADGRSLWPMWGAKGALYFVSDRNGGPQNICVRSSGGSVRTITQFTEGRVHWPRISRDGRRIVFEREDGIWLLETASQQVRPVNITLRGAAHWAGVEHKSYIGGFDEMALSPDGRKLALVVHGEVFAVSARDGGDAVRITRTTAIESHLAWSRNSRVLAYVSNRDAGARHIFMYDFTTGEEFRLTRGSDDTRPRFSPDGRTLAWQAEGNQIRALDLLTRKDRLIVTGQTFDRAPFDRQSSAFIFAPGGDWIAFSAPGPRGFENVHIVPTAAASAGDDAAGPAASSKGATPRQVTFMPNAGSNAISWSPDGQFLLFGTGQRTENYQLARVELVPRTPRFKEDQFRDLFREPRPIVVPRTREDKSDGAEASEHEGETWGEEPATRSARVSIIRPATSPATRNAVQMDTPATRPASVATTTPATSTTTSPATAPASQPLTRPSLPPTKIVFEGIRRRAQLLNLGFDVDFNAISPDGKTALLIGSAAGQPNLYTYPLDASGEAVPRQLTSTTGTKSHVQFSADGKEVFLLDGGKPAAVSLETRTLRYINVVADMDTHFDADKLQVFAQVWTCVRDHFADVNFNGVNWDAARTRYLPRIAGARTQEELRRVLLLMLGELDASHTGISSTASRGIVGRLGIALDAAEYDRAGKLRIARVYALSPAEIAGLKAGEYIVAIDNRRISPASSLDELLQRKIGKRVALRVSADGQLNNAREVALLPVDGNTERNLIYREWVESRRAMVDKLSGGKLGYVHLADMSETQLAKLNVDLDSELQSRAGVVVDVRGNRGGFVNGFAIDVLSRKNYLTMVRRGHPPVPSRVRLGQRALDLPTVLITNRNTYSDGEDFTEAYRALKIGKVVGEPTAGCVIFTSQISLLDGSRLGLPHTHVIAEDGQRLEANPRPVDVEVRRVPGEALDGRDAMLEEAVKVLVGGLRK